MRHVFLIVLSAFLISACNLKEEHRKPTIEEKAALQATGADTLHLNIDSLLSIPIHIAALQDAPVYDSDAARAFTQLARATGGEVKFVAGPELLVQTVRRIIRSHASDNADLLILMDKTGSMEDDIKAVQEGLGKIMDALKPYQHLRLAIALYGDKNDDGDSWFSFQNFEGDYTAARTFIDSVQVTGGGDTPESVYDGYFEALNQGFFRSCAKRMVLLIGDAPPLDTPLSTHTVGQVIARAHEEDITMNFYPVVIGFGHLTEAEPGGKKMPDYAPAKLINNVYPVPSTGMINMSFSTEGTHRIEVFNAAGRLVHSEVMTGRHWQKDFSALSNGVYLIRAASGEHTFDTGRFILQR